MQMGMFSKKYLENKICVALGGRIAEEIVRGKDSVTTSAQNDLEQCTQTAKYMVQQLGMSELVGPRQITQPKHSYMIYYDDTDLVKKVDGEIDRILDEQYQRGKQILLDNKSILDKIAEQLLEKE